MRIWIRRFLRIAGIGLLAATLLLTLAGLFFFRGALHNRYVVFPQTERALEALRAKRSSVILRDGWNHYRGALHTHSKFSHDSEMPFEGILEAAHLAGLDFIFLTDHCVDREADYGIQWRGVRDGVLFVPGFEMRAGFMPWGLPEDVVLDCGEDPHELARQIDALGGVLFFAHSEEERIWDLPELTGMEIYNIHTDLKGLELLALAPDMILNLWRYGDLTMREIFTGQPDIIARWDGLNRERRIVGIAASDSHQNIGLQLYHTPRDTLQLRETGPKIISEWELNPATRLLARVFLGRLTPPEGPALPFDRGDLLWRIDLDPYDRSLRFVNTHLLAEDLSEESLVDALRMGRAFIAFSMLAEADGFTYLAREPGRQAVMGEEIPWSEELELLAESPLPCRLSVFRHGALAHETEGRYLRYRPPGPGNYRVKAELHIRGDWVPWVYANPIRVTE